MSTKPLTGHETPGDPCCIVVFGASGDLTKRKLMPALYNLKALKLLPENFALIGVAVTDPSQEEPLVDLLARADGAMYVSKRGGKGRYALSSAPGQPIIEQPKKAV